MAFSVSQRALEQLDWAEVLSRLAACTSTPRGRARVEADHLFEADELAARERLAETSEARALLDAGESPPLGGVEDLEAPLRRLAAGGTLAARELLDVARAAAALRDTAAFLGRRRDAAPRLAAHADGIGDLRDLEDEIGFALDDQGEVRDAYAPALAEARARARQLAAEVQRRLADHLRDPDLSGALSDAFVTLRNDRYVLPVRADARARVRGIVHDASGSGTTLFIEPEAVVETNNRLRQAELEIERETLRVLRDLSQRAAAALPTLAAGLEALEAIDLAVARGRLSREMQAAPPELGSEGIFDLPQLRHPLLDPARVVPNDLRVGRGPTVLILSGPNAGGKTVAAKALALAALFARAGLHVPADPGARVDLVDALLADIGDEQNLRESLSSFSAHMANLARIVETAGPRSLVLLDEIGMGTDPGEGAALAQSVLEELAEKGARVVATTHFQLLKEMAEVDARFENACVEFDADTLAPTYRLRIGAAGVSSATSVAARMGMPRAVLDRANSLLDREDRRLDRMLAELSTSRVALERERSEAERLRAESEETRERYREKLERLRERRDDLFHSLRADLDRSFREAHAAVAAVIRDLQSGAPSARDAAHARERLLAIDTKRREVEAAAAPAEEEALPSLDWRFASAGDAVRIAGGGTGTLLALPDRRGRVAVQVGGARLLVPAERVGPPAAGSAQAPARPARRVTVEAEDAPYGIPIGSGGSERIDLHGLRVADALERVVFALERAARRGADRLVIVHGLGTGALRDAVREYLRESPYVSGFAAADPTEGGDGATVATLA